MEEQINVGSIVLFTTEDEGLRAFSGKRGIVRTLSYESTPTYVVAINGSLIDAYREELSIAETIKEGDWVRTTQNKCGLVTKSECYGVGIEDGNEFLIRTEFSTYQEAKEDKREFESIKRIMPSIRLGMRDVAIDSSNLRKCSRITIRINPEKEDSSNREFSLPIEEANIVMEVFRRNKVWFHVV